MDPVISPPEALGFIEKHGVVLASAHGPLPNLAEAVAGEAIRGSWWAHDRARDIYAALESAAESPDVLTCRLIAGKRTLVHRRLWPALVRLAQSLPLGALDRVREQHTPTGAHRAIVTPFPEWVPGEVNHAAAALDDVRARENVGEIILRAAQAPRRNRR